MCCENRLYRLGDLNTSSLAEIWMGDALAVLRSSIKADDLDRGCDGCAAGVRSGDRASVRAGLYDSEPAVEPPPPWPVRLELELSNRCNLMCVMCNGELSSSIRTRREHRPPLPKFYGDRFFAELADLAPHLHHVSFLGGEPFLAGESLRAFETLAEAQYKGVCHVTTNGTVASPRVEAILDALHVDVSISLDGATASTVESIRVGASHHELMENVAWFHRHAIRRSTTLALHYCLMRSNWQELHPFLLWADRLDVDVAVLPVRHPIGFSLDHVGAKELTAVIAAMHTMHDEASPLGRNAAVWRRELSRLEAVAAPPTDARATPVSLRSSTTAPKVFAQRLLDEWNPGGARHEVTTGEGGVVLAVGLEGIDSSGLDFTPYVGQHTQVLLGALEASFGRLASSTMHEGPAGIEDRTLRFEAEGHQTDVRAMVIAPTNDEPTTWLVSARRADP